MAEPAAPQRMSEADLQQAMLVGEQLRQQLGALDEQRAIFQQLVAEYTSGREALEALGKAAVGDEILLPVGGGNFVRAHLAESGRVVVAIGAGVHAETTAEKALERLAERIQNLERANERLNEETARLAQDLNRVNAVLEAAAGR